MDKLARDTFAEAVKSAASIHGDTDQVDSWADGELYPMIYEKEEIEKKKVLIFSPYTE